MKKKKEFVDALEEVKQAILEASKDSSLKQPSQEKNR